MILILGKEGILHTLGNDIKNVFQITGFINLFEFE